MKYFKKVEGKRVYLSPVSIDDAEIFVKWLCDSEVAKNTNNRANLYTVEAEKEWINNTIKNHNYTFSIVLKENDLLIGNCSIEHINHIDRTATIGIMIGEEAYRSKGYGSEALNLLLEYGFNTLNMHNIKLNVFSFNERAIACYKKVGFKEYGVKHECYFLDGKYYDQVEMEILEHDFRKSNNY